MQPTLTHTVNCQHKLKFIQFKFLDLCLHDLSIALLFGELHKLAVLCINR